MFTGLVSDVGRVRVIEKNGDTTVTIETAYDLKTLTVGASVACSGVCLTVVDKGKDSFSATISEQTLRCTSLEAWQKGSAVNLERALKLGDEMGGHMVTGHVDCVGSITALTEEKDSVCMEISVSSDFGALLVAKGSVAVDGVSLTINRVEDHGGETHFTTNLIPHTQRVTILSAATVGGRVNIEFDIMARYMARLYAVSPQG